MSERNALPLIKKALEEKTVEVALPEGGNLIKGYLIKISGDVDPFRDFSAMYEDINNKVFEEKERQLRSLRSENPELLKNHGVLIDPETMKIIFTFNMAFADLHREEKRFVRFPPIDIFPVVIPDYYGHSYRDGDPCLGERAKKYAYFPRGKVANCLASFTDALSKHVVSVELPGETVSQRLYLIKIWAKTDLEEDYRISYPGSKFLTIPNEKFREYGVFIRPEDLAIAFAFNTEFARYDRQSETVEYSTVAEILLKGLSRRSVVEIYEPASATHSPPGRIGGMGMHGVIMYALSEPRK